ncbi:MAG: DNA ligase, partial [Aquificaceae bacterium]|nr:DNA ligase [Aquificaceae bacterium]
MLFKELAQYFQRVEETTSRLEMADLLRELLQSAEAGEVDKVVYLTLGELMPSFRGVEFGVSEKLLMDALSKACGIKVKQVEELYKKRGDLGLVAQEIVRWQGRELQLLQVYAELSEIALSRGTLEKVMGL